jgi:hypothetical protein
VVLIFLILGLLKSALAVDGALEQHAIKENAVFQKVLLAYDGSPGVKRALDVVLQLAQTTPMELWAIAVEERLLHLAATIDETEEEKAFANHFYEECLEMASEENGYLHSSWVPMNRSHQHESFA